MDIKDIIARDRFASLVGIELLEAGDGHAKAKLEIKDHHLNAVDIAQGGAIFTLADLTFAAASNSRGNIAVAINVNISFLKAAKPGMLYAEAFENSVNKKIGSYTVNVTDEQGDLVACFQGMVYRKKETFHPD